MKVRDIMSPQVISVAPGAPIQEAIRLMLQNHISGLPVVDATRRAEIDLRPLQTHIEQSAYADLKAALDKHDVKAFEVAYKKGLGECFDCHKAIDKAFLRPVVPKSPGASVIAVEPE